MDFVITLDAEVEAEQPSWIGQPVTALWDYPALKARGGKNSNLGLETLQTLLSLRRRIELLVSLHARGKKATDLQHDLRDMSHV
jgi:hypothetical protein